MVQLIKILFTGSQIYLAPYISQPNHLSGLVLLYLTLLFAPALSAQSYFGLRSEIGISTPIGVQEKEANFIYDNHPIISNWQSLQFDYTIKKSFLRLQIGATTLGYSFHITQGFTPSPYISSGPIPPGLPIDLRGELRITYATLGVGYGRVFLQRLSLLGGIQYLKAVGMKPRDSYTFPGPDISTETGYREIYERLVTGNKLREALGKYHHGLAAIFQMDYAMTKRFFLCSSYLIGLDEFSPYASQPGTRDRLHQNFSIGLEYRFRL